MAEEETLTRLVLAVARLGEADLFGWWRSRGLSEAGAYVLGSALPRTWAWSALEADVLSAALRHDQGLGRATAIHLFSDRLPAKRWAMSWLWEQKIAGSTNGFFARIRGWSRETALKDLAAWIGVPPPRGEVLVEGLRLGSLSRRELASRERLEFIIHTLTAAYLDQPGELRLPYFDLT